MITYELALFIGLIFILLFTIIGLILKINKNKLILGCILIAYLSVVACITLFPILYQEKVEYWGDVTWYNYIPFKTIIGIFEYGITPTALVQFAGNILMTVPYGIIIMFLIEKKKHWKLFLFALSLAVSIELIQLVIGLSIDNMYRTVDIDDIILNILGVYIGYGCYKILPQKIKTI